MATHLFLINGKEREPVPRTNYSGCKGLYNSSKDTTPTIHAIPRIGDIIIINERNVCRKRPYLDNVQIHGYRGCILVTSETPNLITGEEYYNKEIFHTISFRKKDFQCGLLKYIVITQPVYKENHTWHELAINHYMSYRVI